MNMPIAEMFSQPDPFVDAWLGDGLSALQNLISANLCCLTGIARYTSSFYLPYLAATHYFQQVEAQRLVDEPPLDSLSAYIGLLDNNIELVSRSLNGYAQLLEAYFRNEADGLNDALQQQFLSGNPTKMLRFISRQAHLLDLTVNIYPQAIEAIGPEYGFHFESGQHTLVDETDRFYLYQIAPSLSGVDIKKDAKPILIIPPYVLGANILGFLPGEQRSYAHCFSNQGYPTYIRILKPIDTTPALQVMRGEDDALDTQRFCHTIFKTHGKPVTLNGYCQGGFNALCTILSGKIDDLIDAFITCVSPMDGTRSKGLAHFLNRLPARFNDLSYGTKTLANGNLVADGKLMGWIYKLKSIEQEIPAAAFFRDLMMFARQKNGDQQISKTAAALNYWLQYERNDLPLEITRISFESYNTPITSDGTLPIKLFGDKLNLKRISEKKIPWLICYGVHDDLVERETALAPLDYVDAEVAAFPKGHVAIATSWSHPESACALHIRFGDDNHRGPVRFHIDLDAALDDVAKHQAAPSSPPPQKAPIQKPSDSAQQKPSTAEIAAAGPATKPKAAKKAVKAKPATRKKAKPTAKTTAKTAVKKAKPKASRSMKAKPTVRGKRK
jgi:hypothetical protein